MDLAVEKLIILTLGIAVPRTLNFNPCVHHSCTAPGAYVVCTLVQDRPEQPLIAGDRCDSEDRAAVLFAMADLCDAEVLAGTQTIAKLGDNTALIFERARTGNPQAEAQHAHPARLVRCFEQHRLDRADLFFNEGLEHVADLDVVEALEVHSALVALLDFANVVLEAAQAGELSSPEDDPVAQQAYLV